MMGCGEVLPFPLSQDFHGYGRTCLRICKRVVVHGEVIAAPRRDSMQLMVRQFPAEDPAGCFAGTEELIVRIVHPVHPEHRLQAAFVKHAVVRHQRKPFDKRLCLGPYIWEDRCILGISGCQPVYLRVSV